MGYGGIWYDMGYGLWWDMVEYDGNMMGYDGI